MQRGLFSEGPQGPWGRSRCGTDTSSLENRFCAPPEGIQWYQMDNNYIFGISHITVSVTISEQGMQNL